MDIGHQRQLPGMANSKDRNSRIVGKDLRLRRIGKAQLSESFGMSHGTTNQCTRCGTFGISAVGVERTCELD
ncbi:unnamed protein product [Caenorhabditis nigoni]